MSDIPQEIIITDILTRLPVKSLLRFRCVCKPWHGLIDSQKFIKLHLNQTLKSNPDKKLLLSGQELYSTDFDSIFATDTARIEVLNPPVSCLPTGIEIIGCCNGIICLLGTSLKYEETVMLWNPCTREFKELPDFGEWGPGTTGYVGFGYDDVRDDYKVVILMQSPPRATFMVYSLRSNTFGKVQCFPYCYIPDLARGYFVAGGLHWMVGNGPNEPGKRVVALNLTTEKTQEVPLPDCSLKNGFRMNLAVLGGRLSSIYYYYKRNYATDIWIMKDYGKKESWTKIASIVESALMSSCHMLCPISFSKSGKQILLAKNDEELVYYDLEEKSAKNVNDQGHRSLHFQYGVYFGTLVHLNSGSPTTSDERGQGSNQKKNAKRDSFLSTGFKLAL